MEARCQPSDKVGVEVRQAPAGAGGASFWRRQLLAAPDSARHQELAAVLALLVGGSLVAAGLLKLGWIADLLSRPVITGFLAGIAVHIVLAQAPAVIGLPELSGATVQRLSALWADRGAINPIAVEVGLGAFLATTLAERINPRIPGALLALIGAVAVTLAFNLDARGLAVLGRLRRPSAPACAAAHGADGAAGAGPGRHCLAHDDGSDRRDEPRVSSPRARRRRRLRGRRRRQPGGGVPRRVSGQRQPAADRARGGGGRRLAMGRLVGRGRRPPACGFRRPAVEPRAPAALAGVLLFVAVRIVHLRTFAELARRTGAEFALALITAALIIGLPIQAGVAIGIFLALADGVFTITRVRPVVFAPAPGSTVWWPSTQPHPPGERPGVLVIGFQAPLSFLNADDFRRGILRAVAQRGGAVRLVVLEANSIAEIDYTAATVLAELITDLRRWGIELAVARLESVRAMAAFERFGVTRLLGADHLFRSVAEAIAKLGGATAGASPRPPIN